MDNNTTAPGTPADDMFKRAAIRKLRFSYRGVISVEDLFDLTETALDTLYRELTAAKRGGEGLLNSTKVDTDETLRIELVRHVFEYKRAIAEKRKNKAARLAKRQQLLAIIQDKQLEATRAKSVEELMKELDGDGDDGDE